MYARRSYTSHTTGVVAGLLLVLTFLVPFGMEPDGSYWWSWRILRLHLNTMPAADKAFFLGAWAIGVATILVSLVLRRLRLALWYLGLGIGAVLVLWGVTRLRIPDNALTVRLLGDDRTALWLTLDSSAIPWPMLRTLTMVMLAAVGAFLVITGVRVRFGANAVVRAIQIAAGATMSALLCLGLFEELRMVSDLPPAAELSGCATFALLLHGLVVFAGILALVDGLAFKLDRGALARAARAIVFVTILTLLVLPEISRPESTVPVLFRLNPTIMIACLAVLLIEGLVSAVSEGLAEGAGLPHTEQQAPAGKRQGGSGSQG